MKYLILMIVMLGFLSCSKEAPQTQHEAKNGHEAESEKPEPVMAETKISPMHLSTHWGCHS